MNENIMIRIRNDSNFDIENFWLGAGPRGGATENTAFSAIKSGETTKYRGVEPVAANYRKMNMVVNGQRYLDNIDPMQHLSISELEPGHYYTFAYDLIDNQPQLTIIEDQP